MFYANRVLFMIVTSVLLSCGSGADVSISASKAGGGVAQAAYPSGSDGYRLVWSDEFDVDGLPSSDWTFEHGFVRNQELQWYQRQNAFVADGCLVIEGRRERVANPQYVAGSSDWRTSRSHADKQSE